MAHAVDRARHRRTARSRASGRSSTASSRWCRCRSGSTSEIAGNLHVGVSLDALAAERFKALTNSEVAFARGRRRRRRRRFPKAPGPRSASCCERRASRRRARIDGNEYLALTQELAPPGTTGAADRADPPVAHRAPAVPARAAHDARRDRGAGGACRHAPQLRGRAHRHPSARRDHGDDARDGGHRRPDATDLAAADGRWQDEDARLLATTFNSMTDSIERFQREATQRERLSSLGRLSTVIAHEIRNPLMIIKTALRTLRQRDRRVPIRCKRRHARHRRGDRAAEPDRQRGARLRAADQVRARAGRHQLRWRPTPSGRPRPTAPGRPCSCTSIRAFRRSPPTPERLRQVLVNILGNAIQAVEARGVDGAGTTRPSGCETARLDSERVAITCARSRDRHRPGRPGAHLRSVLHDPPDRHRPRSRDLAQHHRRARRTNHRREPAGTRHRGPHRAAASFNELHDYNHGSILLVDDEEKILKALAQALRDEGHEVVDDRAARARRSGCSAERTFDVLHRRQPDAGADRPRPDSRARGVDAGDRAAADPDDDRARHRRERDRGDEARRARLPAEAVRDRRAAGRRPPRARSPAAAHAARAT